jgi:hypothetical protein
MSFWLEGTTTIEVAAAAAIAVFVAASASSALVSNDPTNDPCPSRWVELRLRVFLVAG